MLCFLPSLLASVNSDSVFDIEGQEGRAQNQWLPNMGLLAPDEPVVLFEITQYLQERTMMSLDDSDTSSTSSGLEVNDGGICNGQEDKRE